MKALLIIDVQNDFLPGGALAVPAGDEIVEVINEMQGHFDLVVATQDWHPSNHGSFASAHEGKKPFEVGTLGGMDQVLWPDHSVQGSPGAAFSESLAQNAIEAVFRKGTDPGIDSYSGFFDNGRLKDTGLGAYLKGRGVTQLFLAGLAADYCVAYTALDALDLGFRTFVVEDATRPIDPRGLEIMKKNITDKGGKFLHSAAIIQANQ